MKYINKILLLTLASLFILACQDEDKMPYNIDGIIEDQGAFLRLDDVISGEFDLLNLPGSNFIVELEAWDAEEGSLLQSVDLTVEFIDNTPENGSNPVAQTALNTYMASEFVNDAETGLPNITISYSALDALDALGLDQLDLDGGDVFRFEWTINLTNGKSFNRTNSSSSLPGWPFYNAPFLLDVGVVCLLPETYALGSYALVQEEGPADPFFGEPTTFYSSDVTLEVGLSSTQRVFTVNYLDFEVEMSINLVCGKVLVPETDTGLACAGGPLFWITNEASGAGRFDGLDDSVITVRLQDDYIAGCGITSIIELSLTKN